MPRRTVRRVAAAVLAAPMLALAAPAVASAEHMVPGGVSVMSHGGFGHGFHGFHGGFGHGFHGGFGHGFGGAFFSQSGSFAGPGGAASFNVFSFAR